MRGSVGSGFAEQHIVGASFGREHGIMTAEQTPGAGDALGFQRSDRGGQRRDAGEMGAVGAGAGHKLGMAVDEERHIAALHDRPDRLCAVDQRALVGRFEAKENGRDIAGFERRADDARQRLRIAEPRGEEVKPRARPLRPHPSVPRTRGRVL